MTRTVRGFIRGAHATASLYYNAWVMLPPERCHHPRRDHKCKEFLKTIGGGRAESGSSAEDLLPTPVILRGPGVMSEASIMSADPL